MASRPIKQVIDIGKGFVAVHRANSVYIYDKGLEKEVKHLDHGVEIGALASCGFGVGAGVWFKSRWNKRNMPEVVKEFKRTFLKRLKHDS